MPWALGSVQGNSQIFQQPGQSLPWKREMEFKSRFYNHKHIFEQQQRKHATALLKEEWSIKEHGVQPHIT